MSQHGGVYDPWSDQILDSRSRSRSRPPGSGQGKDTQADTQDTQPQDSQVSVDNGKRGTQSIFGASAPKRLRSTHTIEDSQDTQAYQHSLSNGQAGAPSNSKAGDPSAKAQAAKRAKSAPTASAAKASAHTKPPRRATSAAPSTTSASAAVAASKAAPPRKKVPAQAVKAASKAITKAPAPSPGARAPPTVPKTGPSMQNPAASTPAEAPSAKATSPGINRALPQGTALASNNTSTAGTASAKALAPSSTVPPAAKHKKAPAYAKSQGPNAPQSSKTRPDASIPAVAPCKATTPKAAAPTPVGNKASAPTPVGNKAAAPKGKAQPSNQPSQAAEVPTAAAVKPKAKAKAKAAMPDPNAKQQVDLVDAALARKTTAEILDDKEDKKEVDSEESKRAHAHYMRFTRSLASKCTPAPIRKAALRARASKNAATMADLYEDFFLSRGDWKKSRTYTKLGHSSRFRTSLRRTWKTRPQLLTQYGDTALVDELVRVKTESGMSRYHPEFPGKDAMKQFKVFDEEYEVEESEDEQKCGAEHEYADSTSSSDEDQVETPPKAAPEPKSTSGKKKKKGNKKKTKIATKPPSTDPKPQKSLDARRTKVFQQIATATSASTAWHAKLVSGQAPAN